MSALAEQRSLQATWKEALTMCCAAKENHRRCQRGLCRAVNYAAQRPVVFFAMPGGAWHVSLHPARISILCVQFLPEYSCDPAVQCILRTQIGHRHVLSRCCRSLGAARCCSGRSAGGQHLKSGLRGTHTLSRVQTQEHQRRDLFMNLRDEYYGEECVLSGGSFAGVVFNGLGVCKASLQCCTMLLPHCAA